MDRIKGIILTMISAFVYGSTAIMAKITFLGGSNGMMLAALRGLIPIPFLYLIIRAKGLDAHVSKKALPAIVILSVFGGGITAALLYSSYSYMGVGLSSTLHFMYPIMVSLVYSFVYGERFSRNKWIALFASILGIILLMRPSAEGSVDPFGAFLAIFSAATYAFYIIYMDRTGLKDMDPLVLTFYVCIFNSILLTIISLATGNFTLDMTPLAWIFTVIIALLTAIFGMAFLQLGVRYIGATAASILSTLEPISSLILGMIVLHEMLTWNKVIASALILTAVVLIVLNKPELPPDGESVLEPEDIAA